ncbi:hypothetical protein FN976_11380 [Caenimonas sedimenti]|uniref:Uncharacterized protein n=1 Tax=Caenimonas sedimenti TaxID=2596921 RepID=A0A562ZT39_9BURK|nr:hypothetical protein [Caenimonas sedimenti]TWO71508.1 hypothetical protein FN976_11380 [Caenimonas sedimenti]
MISERTRLSLAQLLEQQDEALVTTLLAKHGLAMGLSGSYFAAGLADALRQLRDARAVAIAAEVVATQGDLRHRVNPKYRFDERFGDLRQCLTLDGYQVQQDKTLLRTDPTLGEVAPIEDDLLRTLAASSAPSRDDILRKIQDSAEAFRRSPPDYNATLTNARIALETLARDVAAGLLPAGAPQPTRWGEYLACIRMQGGITLDEEKAIAGAYTFMSTGAHRSVGISEEQMTRLGRSFALNLCWFLLQNHLARSRS